MRNTVRCGDVDTAHLRIAARHKTVCTERMGQILLLGNRVDERLKSGDVRLAMGGEPTFVSIDDMEGAEWNGDALGPTKCKLAGNLIRRLRARFAPGALLHFGQGKWHASKCRDGPSAASGAKTVYHCGKTLISSQMRKRITGCPQTIRRFSSRHWRAAFTLMQTISCRRTRIPGPISGRSAGFPSNVDPLDSHLEDQLERARLPQRFPTGSWQGRGTRASYQARACRGDVGLRRLGSCALKDSILSLETHQSDFAFRSTRSLGSPLPNTLGATSPTR